MIKGVETNLSQPLQPAQLTNSKQLLISNVVLFCMQLIFSGWHILATLALKAGVNALIFALYREGLASIVLFAMVKLSRIQFTVPREDYFRLTLLGFCSFVNVVGAIMSLKYISASRFALMQPLIPCIGTTLGIVLGLENFKILKGFGIILAATGAILMEVWKTSSSSSSSNDESNIPLGTIIVICQCTGMAGLIVFQKSLLTRYHPLVLTCLYYTIGSLFTVLLCLGMASTYPPSDFSLTGQLMPFLALGYAVLFANCLNYSLYGYVTRILEPSVVTIYSTVQPVGTVILSIIIFGSSLSLSQGVGGFLVALGLIVTVYSKRQEMAKEKREGNRSMSISNHIPFDVHAAFDNIAYTPFHGSPALADKNKNSINSCDWNSEVIDLSEPEEEC